MPCFIVAQELDGISVRSFLRRHCNVSARLLARLKRTENGMTVNGRTVRSIDVLKGGDRIELTLPADESDIEPVELPIEIVYEDETMLVLNKPPFMPVHPVHEHQMDTLANAVMYYYRQKGEKCTFRAVNRLDKDTSGLVIAAKSGYAHTFLSSSVKKKYTALCEGILEGSGTVDAPIRIKEGHTIQREAGEGGVSAVTHYIALCSAFGHTLLSLSLETGRTHQIRTHLSHIGHPLAGDEMYGGSRKVFQRQCLHCSELEIIKPVSMERLVLKSSAEDWIGQLKKYFSSQGNQSS